MVQYGVEYRRVYTPAQKEEGNKKLYSEFFEVFFTSRRKRNKEYRRLKREVLVINVKKIEKDG